METKQEIEKLVSLYQLTFPGEQSDVDPLILFLQNTPTHLLFSRTNFVGHITASAFVVDEKGQKLLLIHHKKLNRWLQPGGHVDEADISLFDAAARETAEETGLQPGNLRPFPSFAKGAIFDIDSHIIPANINKNEPEHVHHDLRFLFTCPGNSVLQARASEANNITWFLLNELLTDETFGKIAQKIKRLVFEPPGDLMSDKLV